MLGIIYAVYSFVSHVGDSVGRMNYSRKRLREAKEKGEYSYIDWYGDERSTITGQRVPKRTAYVPSAQEKAEEYYNLNANKIIESLDARRQKIKEKESGECSNEVYKYGGLELITRWDEQTQKYKDIPYKDKLMSLRRSDDEKDWNTQRIPFFVKQWGSHTLLDAYEYSKWMEIPVDWKKIFEELENR